MSRLKSESKRDSVSSHSRSLRTRTVTDNSDIPTPSDPIITGRKVGGRNKRGGGNVSVSVKRLQPLPWQKLATKQKPYAWRAFRREFRRQHPAGSAVYGYEWEWFLRGWKARVRSQPLNNMIRKLTAWGYEI